jgi:hypothetical protein
VISVKECAELVGLESNELIIGVAPSRAHRAQLSGYLLNMDRGPTAVRDMIVADLRMFLDLGATRAAADALVVLRIFLREFPMARRSVSGDKPSGASTASLCAAHDRIVRRSRKKSDPFARTIRLYSVRQASVV